MCGSDLPSLSSLAGRIGFATSPDLDPLLADVQQLKPFLFVAMPDFWSALFSKYAAHVTAALSALPRRSSPAQVTAVENQALAHFRAMMGGRLVATGPRSTSLLVRR